jgi:hypothetical protein
MIKYYTFTYVNKELELFESRQIDELKQSHSLIALPNNKEEGSQLR